MGWAGGYKRLQQPWWNIMWADGTVHSLVLFEMINPGPFGVLGPTIGLVKEDHGWVRDPGVQVLSFKIKLWSVMRHVEQLLRLCQDWNVWVVYFQIREKRKNSRKGIFEKSFHLIVRHLQWILMWQIRYPIIIFVKKIVMFSFLIGVGKSIGDSERVEALHCSSWKLKGHVWGAMHHYQTRSERYGWWWGGVMCHVMQIEVIMSLVLAFHIPPP